VFDDADEVIIDKLTGEDVDDIVDDLLADDDDQSDDEAAALCRRTGRRLTRRRVLLDKQRLQPSTVPGRRRRGSTYSTLPLHFCS
jgi:hypothetical protein